jgi:PEP-CTERM motif-containing protein
MAKLSVIPVLCGCALACSNLTRAHEASDVTFVSPPNGCCWAPLTPGPGEGTTFGEVFVAPQGVQTRLDSFSFFLYGDLTGLYGGVAPWTGTGAGPALFTSKVFSGTYYFPKEVTIDTNDLRLIPGHEYVAYFSIAGITGVTGADDFEFGVGSPIGVGFAFDDANGGSPNHSEWTGCKTCSPNLQYNMTFDIRRKHGVPEPDTLAPFALGLVGIGLMRRRKAS